MLVLPLGVIVIVLLLVLVRSIWCASWRSARLPGSMRLIWLAVILAGSFVLAPLAVEAQQAGKVARIAARRI